MENYSKIDQDTASVAGSSSSSCHCRYCDSDGLIWDGERDSNMVTTADGIVRKNTCCWTFVVDESSNNNYNYNYNNTRLRRSWSESSSSSCGGGGASSDYSYHPTIPCPVNNNGITTFNDDNNYVIPSAAAFDDSSNANRKSCPGLRVSSEIVTSPDGHRDIEIKFYTAASSSPLVVG